MTTDIKAVVAELERLEREATQGPWAPDLTMPYSGGDYGCSGVECLEEHSYPLWKDAVAKSWTQTVCTTPHDGRYSKGEQARTNMEFIAAARNALPSLLAELRRLWAKEERQQAIEDAARRYRDIHGELRRVLGGASSKNKAMIDEILARLDVARLDARDDLFAALDAKSTKEEQ
mgnify:FL=1